MGITVQHSPNPYLVGVGAYGAGVAQFQKEERVREDQQQFAQDQQQRQITASQQQQLMGIQAQQVAQYNQQAYQAQQQQAEMDYRAQMAQYNQYAEMERMYAQSVYDSQKIFDVQKAKEQQVQYEYTQGQQQKLAQLNESYAYLDNQLATGEISDWQAEQMYRQLDAEYMGIKKMPQTAGHQYPQGTEPGKVFYVRNQQDADLIGLPPVVDPVSGNAIPLVRDPETGQIETLRGYPSGQAAVDKSSDIQIKQQQTQAKIDLDREQAQQKMELERWKVEQSQEVQRQKAAADYVAKRMAQKQVGQDGLAAPPISYEKAQEEAARIFGSPSGGQPTQQPGGMAPPTMQSQPTGQQTQLAAPAGMPLDQEGQPDPNILSIDSFMQGVQTGAFKNPEEAAAAAESYTGLYEAMQGYQQGADAVLGMAWLSQQFGMFRDPGDIPDPSVRPLASSLIRVVSMSGRIGIPQPTTPEDFQAIPSGARFLYKGQVHIKP